MRGSRMVCPAVQKESAEIDCSEFNFPFHGQVHERSKKYWANKHSIAYTEKIENIETVEEIEAITCLITSVVAVQMRLLIFCLQRCLIWLPVG